MYAQQVAGAALVLIFLADVFLTVLYARAGTSFLARYVNRAAWTGFWLLSRSSPKHKAAILSLAGPCIVVLLIFVWALGLTVGAALIVQPLLGGSIRSSGGSSLHDFVTALFVGGSSMSVVSASNYYPQTAGTRLLFLFNALVGASVLSLTLSYLVQVYSALRERNSIALTVDMMSDCTGDAACALARLGSDGKFQAGYSELANLATSLSGLKESHHFYPLLFYFRFRDPRYSVSRVCFIMLDLVTLIENALDEERYGWLARSSAVARLRHGSTMLVDILEMGVPVSGGASREGEHGDVSQLEQHYAASCCELEASGLKTTASGLRRYAAERMRWETRVVRVALRLGYSREEVTGGPRTDS